MIRQVLLAAVLVAFPLVQLSLGQGKPSELESVWEGQSPAAEGKTRVLAPGTTRMTFKGDTLLAAGILSVEEKKLSFVIDTAVSPKRLDFWEDAPRRMLCLYSIDDDTLTIATSRGSYGPRPAEISSAPGSGAVLLVLKRKR